MKSPKSWHSFPASGRETGALSLFCLSWRRCKRTKPSSSSLRPAAKKKGLGGSIDPKYVRKKCPIEMGADGNYQITMVMNRVTNRLIQTKDPNSIRVVREGLGVSKASDEMKDSLFRRKEMK